MGPTISKPESSATASSTSGASGTSGSAQPAVPEQERPRVGNYEVLQKIGEGTEATVFTVRDVRDGSIKVLKALHPGRGTGRKSPGYVQSFLSAIRHPNIVEFIECFEVQTPQTRLCIVMEYCPAGELYVRIRQLQKDVVRLPEEWIMKWLIELVSALEYLHSKSVVHRDLKPENIFLDSNYTAKLGDFGVSRILDETGVAKTFTGTICYMAPEMLVPGPQIRYGAPVDIWALGCIAFELTTPSKFIFEMQDSRLPGFVLRHRGDTPADQHALIEIEQQQHATMSSYIPEMYSEEFKNLIFAMMRADPSVRITAADILALPFVQEWKRRIADTPPRVEQLESLLLCRRFHWEGTTWVFTRKGDITQENVDVIVVPNDERFSGTGGLSKIVCERNPSMRTELQDAITARGSVPGMADPVYIPTDATENGVSARGVIHVVGPMDTTNSADEWLEKTFQNCMQKALEINASSICFPAIGTGGARISAARCARAFFRVIRRITNAADAAQNLASITLLCNDIETLRAFSEAYSRIIEKGHTE